MSTKPLLIALAALSALGMTACGSAPKYRCASGDQGMPCMSVQQVYDATHGGQLVQPAGKAARPARQASAGAGTDAFDIAFDGDSLLLVDAPQAFAPDAAVVAHPAGPRRTAARILRIWLSPWEDELGDLHMAGHVYTEIEGRRWEVGVKAPDMASRLELLTPPEPAAAAAR
jgi:conjugal transfer pilus assembly protein TraV